MTGDQSGLTVSGAVVRYPSSRRRGEPTTAVDGVSLRVAPGRVLALLGPSGCGKSSLLRAIAGLEPLAAGAVRWDGEDLADVPVHKRGFGLMFQDGQLFEHRDVAGNIAYGLPSARGSRRHRERKSDPSREEVGGTARGFRPHRERIPARSREDSGPVARGSSRERVAEMLDLVGLAGFEGRSVSSLSGGQRQRVALARSLAPSPRLLLLDEPLSSLDRQLREELTAEVARVLRASGTTALYVTHDHAEAFAVADEVGIMIDGRLVQVATPETLLAAPDDERVAAFLGLS